MKAVLDADEASELLKALLLQAPVSAVNPMSETFAAASVDGIVREWVDVAELVSIIKKCSKRSSTMAAVVL